MTKKHLKVAILVVLVVAFFAPSCLAKAKGYFYVVAYSYQDKTVYCSSIFIEKVRDISYSDEEFVAEVKLLRKIETAFEKYLAGIANTDLSKYTLGGRGAYKSLSIAKKRQDNEKKDFTKKGMVIKDTPNFEF